jgi:hypothetical protein
MKKLTILSSILFIAALGFVSCSEDKTTELGWTNKSGAAINTISWASGDATWEKTDGYADQADTESKEVSKLEGGVDCNVFDGAEFVGADSVILGDNQTELTLSEGESLRYDIQASLAKKK